MATVRDHYEQLLAPVYTWMSGGAEARIEAHRALFRQLGFRVEAGAGETQLLALDLGAGSGFQSIPLAQLGYRVIAVDLSAALLAELNARSGTLPIRTIERDFFPLSTLAPSQPQLIVCMGDTLTHLDSHAQARRLIAESAALLTPDGALVLSWRDLTRLPDGNARFLPIRSDTERIFTCFLEAVDETRVRVHDIVHERSGAGFTQRVSSYEKLRIAPEWMDQELSASGFRIETATAEQGWVTRVARRTA